MKTSSLISFRAVFALAAPALLGFGCDSHEHGVASGGGHKHGSAHGGVAVELGDHQYHIDFLADPGTGTLKAWVMDAHAEEFVRVTNATITVKVTVAAAERTLELAARANPTTGETVGDTSEFGGNADWLKGVGSFTAVLPRVELRGKTFTNIAFSYPQP
ncbi:MAG: hypothetical protein AB7O66_11905 [Limisphaerales bacterium]